MKDQGSSTNSESQEPRKKIPLLRKFDLPVHHLDFGYVGKCSDVREIERILRVLRSGEEGHYPELLLFVEDRLKTLDPNSRCLRVEVPVLKSEYLDKSERDEIQNDLLEWIGSFENNSLNDSISVKKIFTDMGDGDGEVPIRGHEILTTAKSSEDDNFVKTPNSNRIKSWEYDKWDKLDVEAELTKLEVTDMQINEWEKFQKPKIQAEQKNVERCMKNEDKLFGHNEKSCLDSHSKLPQKPKSSLGKHTAITQKPKMSSDKPSFIEELPVDGDKGSSKSHTGLKEMKPKRRIKIQIEDVNMGY